MSFRRRIIVAILPLFALWIVAGVAGMVVIYLLGTQVGTLLHENYDSIVFMRDLNEALERIDSSFQFELAGKDALDQYESNWRAYVASLKHQQVNVTILPQERMLTDSLTELTDRYKRQGEAFLSYKGDNRAELYFGKDKKGGLYETFQAIKRVSGDISRLNEDHMQRADRSSRRLANTVMLWYSVGIVIAIALAVLLTGRTIRNIARPVKAVTDSAAAIGAGNLDQLVPVTSDDELGQLGKAFNGMATQLRHFRTSHQAQLLRAQQTSQATIDSFPEPVLLVDPEQVVEMANPAARRLLGVRPREDGHPAAGVWKPPEALRQPLLDALRKQADYLPEGFDRAIVIRSGEQSRFYLPRILPIRDQQSATLGAAVHLEDITRFHLLDEVKSSLVATVSHELKTPLTSLRLVLHLLLEETVGALSPKQLELVIDARDNAERMLAIINNLLDLTRLEQGGSLLRKKSLSPDSLIKMAAESIQLRAKDKGVDVVVRECQDLPPIAVDVDQLQHAFHNLLNNSLTHTPQGGTITLAAEPASGSIVFSVTDTGTGIPPEHIEHIFEKYYRIPGDAAMGGSGLGLAIVREIVVAHGGRVECESVPGQRTVFRLTLPIAEEPTPTGLYPTDPM